MDEFAAPVAFYFQVNFAGGPAADAVAFQEAGGLAAEVDREALEEGGENRFVHRLPKPARLANLTLKRGVVAVDSALTLWVKGTLENDLSTPIVPKDLMVSLLDAKGAAIRRWAIDGAYPVKWSVSAFDARENQIAIESLEFAFANFSIVD